MYHRYLTNRVISSLGHVKLQDLTGDMFQTLYARWLKEKMSPNTIRLIHTIIKKALDDALRLRKISLNPVRDAEPPRAREKEMQVLDIVQAKKLLEAAKDTRLDCLLHVALLGLRRGELLGLQWHDIDFERKELKVGRSLSYVNDPETGIMSLCLILLKLHQAVAYYIFHSSLLICLWSITSFKRESNRVLVSGNSSI